MSLDFIFIIFLCRYFRKSLQTSGNLAKWDKILTGLTVTSIVLMIFDILDYGNNTVIKWIANLIMLSIVYVAFSKSEFRQFRSMMYAVLPFLLVSVFSNLIETISKPFYNRWENYFENANVFAVIWFFGMWYVVNKQKKALDKEKLKTKEKEAENVVTAALKAELEIQVAERTSELTFQKEELQHIINELKATQAQLIQSEKMASLGELTAGIAHEIQNPLNFVNNFAEVSTELADEMEEALAKNDKEEAIALAGDIKENLNKINHHGKRADAIVKGMLQHSRASSGRKEPTDINALADEYLRLSYHGLRAKDKSFNADFKTDFDENLQKINIVSQDIGRVLLNLFNNAFYAVNEKKKELDGSFHPKVTVSTTKDLSHDSGDVIIIIKDNGNGVPQNVIDKIFQPFFTTKPTGAGTGLGLSLSYDIIKAHGGELSVETKEGQGAEFIIKLPQ